LRDDAIYEIAQQQPKDVEALGRLRTIPKGWERSATGAAVLEAVNTALALPRSEMPHVPRQAQPPEGAAAAVELLKVLLKLISEKHGVAPKVIANSDDLDRIAAEGETADVGAMHGWRRDLSASRRFSSSAARSPCASPAARSRPSLFQLKAVVSLQVRRPHFKSLFDACRCRKTTAQFCATCLKFEIS
jgi:hypothetical protein